jgi:hypothetical protein
MNDQLKNLIEKINLSLKELNENIPKLVSILLKAEEDKKEAKIPEGYISFNFVEPIPKMSGLEGFLINRILNKESAKHGIEFILNKDKEDRIIQIFVKGSKEHTDHVISACKWINEKLIENKKKEAQETKNIPSDLL